jgi:hypothetical protein
MALRHVLLGLLFFAWECPRDNPNHHAHLQDHVEKEGVCCYVHALLYGLISPRAVMIVFTVKSFKKLTHRFRRSKSF